VQKQVQEKSFCKDTQEKSSLAVTINVIRHTETQHQLDVCKALELADSKSTFKNKDKIKECEKIATL
jgi:hypothetical protein